MHKSTRDQLNQREAMTHRGSRQVYSVRRSQILLRSSSDISPPQANDPEVKAKHEELMNRCREAYICRRVIS
jgi:hypothetical protein